MHRSCQRCVHVRTFPYASSQPAMPCCNPDERNSSYLVGTLLVIGVRERSEDCATAGLRITADDRRHASIAVRRCLLVSTLTIRQVDDRTHAGLRARAAKHGRSVEAEVRAILDAAVSLPEDNILLALRASVARVGGVDLPITGRTDRPRPVDLL